MLACATTPVHPHVGACLRTRAQATEHRRRNPLEVQEVEGCGAREKQVRGQDARCMRPAGRKYDC
eukprot:1568584-Pyramimonas_sp.AAC.1